MSKVHKQSHISAQKTPNYSVVGNPMSSYTGGYQYSHMHQSLDAEEMEPIYDELNDNILVKEGI